MSIEPTPSSYKVKKTLKIVFPENINGSVFELGCGWGLVSILKRSYPNNKIFAYETSTLPFLWSYLIHDSCVSNKNFLNRNFSDASLVICYLCPKIM